MLQVQNALIALALLGPIAVWSEVSAQSSPRSTVNLRAQASAVTALNAVPLTPSDGLHVAVEVSGEKAVIVSKAATVGALLDELGVHPAARDIVTPNVNTPLTEGMKVRFAPLTVAAVVVDGQRRLASTTSTTVGDLLHEENITLGAHDRVFPAIDEPVPVSGVVRIQRVRAWTMRFALKYSVPSLERRDSSLAYGQRRVVQTGRSGTREEVVLVGTIDGKAQRGRVLRVQVTHHARPRIVAIGTRRYLPRIEEFAAAAFSQTAALAHGAFSMIATAYTAYCDTCSGTGRGATGIRVSHGVVAVDPRVIPLGSHLFIPGYGPAIAGDTGGDIQGRRIDLAMDSTREALNFGRRPITIYLLDASHKH